MPKFRYLLGNTNASGSEKEERGEKIKMALSIASRFKNAFNIFMHPDHNWRPDGPGYGTRPDRHFPSYGNDKSIVTVLYNRIAMDAAAVEIQHVRLDKEDRFLSVVNSELNNCLTLDANIDQTGRALIQDAVLSMLDEGAIAIVPIDTDENPRDGSFDVLSLRVGKIVEWYPMDIRVEVYDERTGRPDQIVVSKETTAIVENPFYSVVNQPNSTMKRLIRKLRLLDLLDERIASGKLDIIIQLPYMMKGESRRAQAEKRRKAIEDQLIGGKYGIAYIDSTEHITQLNRPAENAFVAQVENLTNMAYSQLGMSKEILDGTANENAMQNYYTRTVEPIVSAITDEMKRKFLTKTARTQGQSIEAFRDPFKLVPVSTVAEMADKFIRNQILTPNEFRQIIGRKPSDDAKADELRNPNITPSSDETGLGQEIDEETLSALLSGVNQNGSDIANDMTEEDFEKAFADLDELDAQIDDLDVELNGEVRIKHYASPYYDPVKAHEYYMKTRELKGYGTKSLNDTGKSAAAYVKKLLEEERKKKVAESKARMNAAINKSKEETDSGISKSKSDTDAQIARSKELTEQAIARSKELTNAAIARSKEDMNAAIARSKEATDEAIAKRKEKQSEDLASEKEITKQNIAAYKSQTDTKIQQLKDRLSGMSKATKAANKDRINEEIAQLRADNTAQREKLNAAYKEFSTTRRAQDTSDTAADRAKHKETSENLRSQHKSTSEEQRAQHKTTTTDQRAQHKTTSTNLRTKHKETSVSEREKHKSNVEKLKEEYTQKYLNELARLNKDSAMKKKKK